MERKAHLPGQWDTVLWTPQMGSNLLLTVIHQAMFDILEADIVVMQETKIQRKDLTDDMVLVPGWDVYFSLPRHKKGSSSPIPLIVQNNAEGAMIYLT